MKIIIIEDEPLAAENLADIIKELRPKTEILAILSSVKESIKWLKLNQSPDLIFCDIHLTDGKSFEIFKEVEVNCPIVFTTAYDQYAIEAFKVNSVDYLLKPIMIEDVAKALKKYESLQKDLLLKNINSINRMVQASNVSERKNRTRFLIKLGQMIKAIPVEDIAGFMAEEGVVFIITFQDKKFIINETLDQLEEQLDIAKFFRINRHFILNIEAIEEIKSHTKGRFILRLNIQSGMKQIVSSSRAPSFKEWLNV